MRSSETISEVASTILGITFQKDIDKLEKVSGKHQRLERTSGDMPYVDRMKELEFFKLEKRKKD